MKATDIMHPEDAKAIQMIKSVPGCEQLIRVFMKLGYEAQYRGENLANHIKVTLKSFSEIYRLFKERSKSTRLNSSHDQISYAVFCLKKVEDCC